MATSVKDLEDRLARSMKKLDKSNLRFDSGQYSIGNAWFPTTPSFRERLLSDFSIASGPDDLAKEFQEEVAIISECLSQADSRAGDDITAMARLMGGVNRRAQAMEFWEFFCVPLRHRNGFVFQISPPSDVMGTPVIKSVGVSEYIAGVARHTANDAASLFRLTRQLRVFQTLTALLAILSVLLLLT